MNLSLISRKRQVLKKPHQSRSTLGVCQNPFTPFKMLMTHSGCIVYTWDYHSSISFWNGLRVQPILADEVQTFKALITVHKVLQEGHPVVCYTRKVINYWLTLDNQTLKEAHGQAAWLETSARSIGTDGQKGMRAALI